jgi:hypothetical protein
MIGIVCLIIVLGAYQQVQANQGDLPDSVVLFEYTEPFETSWTLNQPALVANPDGRLHLFWGVSPVQDTAIYYMELADGVWSEPADILLGPNMQTANAEVSAVLDSRGYLHVIWYNNGLYYSYAFAEAAKDPRAWHEPVEIAPSATDGRLFVDGNDRLHVIYVDSQDPTVLSYLYCESAACNWTAPSMVATAGQGEAIRLPNLWISTEGILHAVWGQVQLPDGWPPTGVYYSRSFDDGFTWSQSVQLGGEGQGNPAIIGLGEDELHLIWLATQPGRYHTRSSDGGATWRGVQQFTPVYGGMLVGHVSLILDSTQQIHLFVGGSGLLLHSIWNGQQWLPFEPIGRGERAVAAITQGNTLHLVWLDPTTMHYTSKVIPNAPVVVFTPIPEAEQLLSTQEAMLVEPPQPLQAGPTPVRLPPEALELPSVSQTPHLVMPLLFSLGSAGLLAGVVFWAYWSRRKGLRR